MLFSEVIGQQSVKQGLIHARQSGRFPHGVLFLGREGAGGLPLALALSQYLLCENPGATDACSSCPSCRRAHKLEHADLHLSFPAIRTDKPKREALSRNYIEDFRKFVKHNHYNGVYEWLQELGADNKQGNITADECREIIESLSLKSYEGGAKVLVLWMAEYLQKSGNILLKLIEEPPANTFLIFVAEAEEEILPTILSRLQIIRLPPLSAAEIAGGLFAQGKAEDERSAQLAAVLAEGSYKEALRLIAGGANDLFPQFRNWFNAVFTNNGVQLGRFADTLSKEGREGIKDFLKYAQHLLQIALRQHYLPQETPHLPAEEAQFVKKLAQHPVASANSIGAMSEVLSDTFYQIERNANPKIVLHGAGIKMVRAIKVWSQQVAG